MTVKKMMWLTSAAMLPAAASALYLYGAGVVWRVLIAVGVAAAAEVLCLRWRRLGARVDDGSAVITGLIIALSVPPAAPWYAPAAAALFGVVLAKHCYGGLGNNPFNPAMAGYALAFVSFPAAFAHWGADDAPARALFADAASAPTPLTAARLSGADAPPLPLPLFSAAAAAGGIALLFLRVADWRLPAAFLLGAFAVTIGGGGDWRLLLHGGMVFAAFFVVTDPVTAAATPGGRWLYGIGIGALAAWLRARGAHADGIAFAVLIGNMLAPACDFPARRWRRR